MWSRWNRAPYFSIRTEYLITVTISPKPSTVFSCICCTKPNNARLPNQVRSAWLGLLWRGVAVGVLVQEYGK